MLGALTFASARERGGWSETLVKRLQLVAEVFATAIVRAHSDQALRESEEQLRRTLDEVQHLRDQLQQQNVYLQQEVKLLHGHARIVGQSQALKRVLAQVEQVAPTGSTVLLLGETGTGRELIASTIHELSPRRHQQMVRVNCSAIPTSLIESELSGREKGAYTGALSKQIGRFELANGSTLFLDEIGKDFMLSHGYIKNDFDVQKWAAPEFLEQAAKELFEERWKKATAEELSETTELLAKTQRIAQSGGSPNMVKGGEYVD